MSDAAAPHDLSPWGMYLAADPIVKGIFILLVVASILTWTVWLAKTLEIGAAKRRLRLGVHRLRAARSLSDAADAQQQKGGAISKMVATAARELELSAPVIASDALRERVALSLGRIEADHVRRMGRGIIILAIVGSTAPFVGLLGTVWGIMNSFIGIARENTTNLAVVAPGIAEALLATAVGLAAAIPAVVIYNLFVRSLGGYRALLGDAIAEVQRLASRQQDFMSAGLAAPRLHRDTME